MLHIVCGGQLGYEGKGKVIQWFEKHLNVKLCVRVGGNNTHTIYDENLEAHTLRQLPVGAVNHLPCVIATGSYIDKDMLLREISNYKYTSKNLWIDSHSVIINKQQSYAETISQHIINGNVLFAKDDNELSQYTCDTSILLRSWVNKTEVMIEGVDGLGLSLFHGNHTAGIDTSASGILSMCGLSPFDVANVIMVLRAFPVSKMSIQNEITWDDIADNVDYDVEEYEDDTDKLLHVGSFSPDIVIKALNINKPNIVVMNFLDYIDGTQSESYDELSDMQKQFIQDVEKHIKYKINYGSTDEINLFEIKQHFR